ncbi:helix-turn-helix domain-containing protein [Enterobacter sp. MF024]|uniref:helix-turn-helix domain-containing protein n=1 Tax=Enterobacter sp. MF024 TaxID=2555644 RepID=UPI001107325A|nr:helix-turn-helix domain-containing protein [Enterobacter sp. MF024]TLU68299.1 helix-turn-helix domain-containing protein [Enterobacter sp. MF024]
MLMSKAEYARHCGVSRQTVYEWIEKGEIALAGRKIDVEATELLQRAAASGEVPSKTGSDLWPHRTLEMTWGEFWKAVKAGDRKHPAPTAPEEIQQRVLQAADELGVSASFLDDGQGIYLNDGDLECYIQQYDLLQNAELAIDMLRRYACLAADEAPDDIDDWSPEGIKALSIWDKSR